MTTYWLGDAPATPLVLVPTRDGDDLELDLYATASASLRKPSGATVNATATLTTVDDELELQVQLPTLDEAGLSTLTVTLTTSDDRTDRLDPVPIVVSVDDGWHTLASARLEWPDARTIDDVRLWVLLTVSRGEVVAYAPQLPDPTVVPLNYREGQLMHARNRLSAGVVDPGSGSAGGDGFQLTPFPLDWLVKQTLRPQGRKVFR